MKPSTVGWNGGHMLKLVAMMVFMTHETEQSAVPKHTYMHCTAAISMQMETIGDHTHRKKIFEKSFCTRAAIHWTDNKGQTDRQTFRQVDQTTDNKYTRIN